MTLVVKIIVAAIVVVTIMLVLKNLPDDMSPSAYLIGKKDWMVADSVTLTGDQQVISLKAPSNYNHLKLVAQGRLKRSNTAAVNTTTSICVRFNNDASTSYTRQLDRIANGSTVFTYATEPFIYVGEWPLNANDTVGVLIADIPFYRNASTFKNLLGKSGTTSFVQSTYGRYLNKDIINSVQLIDAANGMFEAGSIFTLYAYL